MSDKRSKLPTSISTNSFNQEILFFDNTKIQVTFVGRYLKQDKSTFNHNVVVNIVIVYEINLWSFKYSSDFMLKSCLFGAVKLTKNVGPNK